MSKIYSNPPIIEAVCEFLFNSETKMDFTIPGLFYEKVKKDYPIKTSRNIQQTEIIQKPQGGLEHRINTLGLAQIFSSDEKKFFQLGTNLLSINCLPPYPTWNVYKPQIAFAFKMLKEVVEIKGFSRIGLRYINCIQFEELDVDLDQYFGFRPFLDQKIPQTMGDFQMKCFFSFNEDRDRCKVQLNSRVPDQKYKTAFILDLDYYLNKPQEIKPENALEWIETAHQKVESIFEGCISDPLRKIFGEKN